MLFLSFCLYVGRFFMNLGEFSRQTWGKQKILTGSLSYNLYRLVAVSPFAIFALFCFQLLSIVLLEANKKKLLVLYLIADNEFFKMCA